MRSCETCKHIHKNLYEWPCIDCENSMNWELRTQAVKKERAIKFLGKCDELDAAMFTGDVLLDMRRDDRLAFVEYLTRWFKKFAEVSCALEEDGGRHD